MPVTKEKVRLEREPITDANRGDATAGPDISEEEHEVTLTEERPVVPRRPCRSSGSAHQGRRDVRGDGHRAGPQGALRHRGVDENRTSR